MLKLIKHQGLKRAKPNLKLARERPLLLLLSQIKMNKLLRTKPSIRRKKSMTLMVMASTMMKFSTVVMMINLMNNLRKRRSRRYKRKNKARSSLKLLSCLQELMESLERMYCKRLMKLPGNVDLLEELRRLSRVLIERKIIWSHLLSRIRTVFKMNLSLKC
jgi:hypothetical protein